MLCDTNGGMVPTEFRIVSEIRELVSTPLGIHSHNDSGVAVAALVAVALGIDHVQGTINGLVERCGNADCVLS